MRNIGKRYLKTLVYEPKYKEDKMALLQRNVLEIQIKHMVIGKGSFTAINCKDVRTYLPSSQDCHELGYQPFTINRACRRIVCRL